MAGRKRKKVPAFVSIEVAEFNGIASVMTDEELGRWWRKGLSDWSSGCLRNDVDATIRAVYDDAKANMDHEYERKHANYENSKTKTEQAEQAPTSYAPPVGAAVYGSEQNVYLTPGQYNELVALAAQWQMRLDDVNRAIESLSCKLKDGTQKSADHFATLKGWINYRGENAKKEEENRPKTFAELENERFVKRGKELGLL